VSINKVKACQTLVTNNVYYIDTLRPPIDLLTCMTYTLQRLLYEQVYCWYLWVV